MNAQARRGEWDAQAYTRLGGPMQGWGEAMLARLALRGDETALDLGCGSGRLTEVLLERLPHGRVIAIDRSRNMVDEARAYLEPRFGGRVDYQVLALEDLDLDETADLVFSNATFHWVPDHPRLFGAIYRALKPGGWLVAQCGGGPNIAIVRQRAGQLMQQAPYAAYFAGWGGPWEFASAEVTRDRLRAAGFRKVETETFAVPVVMPDFAHGRDYLEKVILGSHLERLPTDELRQAFVQTLAEMYARDDPPFVFDYWRLNLSGQRPLRGFNPHPPTPSPDLRGRGS